MRAGVFDIDEAVTTRGQRTPRVARYDLDVIGAAVLDVVTCAGGWLFDRVMAGWDVTVAVPQCADPAPLQILGVRAVALDSLFGSRPANRPLAVAGALGDADHRVHELVGAALRSARTEITLTADAWVPTLGSRGTAVRHELSSAARVFKTQALTAAGPDSISVAPYEAFFSHGRPVRTDHPDLIPAG